MTRAGAPARTESQHVDLHTFRIAFRALARNKMRTALTMLGMIIGVGAVITMVALGNGAQAAIEEQIRGAGTNMITVFPGNFTAFGGVRMGEGQSPRLVAADAVALRALPDIAYVVEAVSSRQQIIAANQNWNASIVGTNVDFPMVKSWPMKYGSFFSEQDVQSAAKVIALGVNVSDILFGADVDPTGQNVRVRNHVMKVVGVMAPKGASSSGQARSEGYFVFKSVGEGLEIEKIEVALEGSDSLRDNETRADTSFTC